MTPSPAKGIWHSTSAIEGYPGYPERSGEHIEVIGIGVDEDETQILLYKVRFDDGLITDAYPEEVVEPEAACLNRHVCSYCNS